jgi:hypothetical protein
MIDCFLFTCVTHDAKIIISIADVHGLCVELVHKDKPDEKLYYWRTPRFPNHFVHLVSINHAVD